MQSTPYHQYATEIARVAREARNLPLGGFPPAPRPTLAPNAPRALFFSPHPDDECISGGPAVRLLREAGMNVINVAVTQGSNKQRQAARLVELQHACDFLGFGLETTRPGGLEKINPKTRAADPAYWAGCVEVILQLLQKHQPKVVLFPHDHDWNSTHIGTHHLVVDALQKMPANYECFTIETEFWGAMTDPNLMLELGPNDLADMMAATSFHVGEVNRNPYQVTLPAWAMDNVRRGGEIVGGQGGGVPDFSFAVLCRLRRWKAGQLTRFYEDGRQVPASMNIADALK